MARQLGASVWQIALLTSIPLLGYTLSLFWASRQVHFTSPVSYVTFATAATRVLFLGMAWVTSPAAFVACACLAQFLIPVHSPAYTEVMRQLYPEEIRGKAMGSVRMVSSISTMAAASLGGKLLDLVGFQVVFPIAAVAGVAASWVFLQIPYPAKARAEMVPISRLNPFQLSRLLRADPVLKRFESGFFLYGFGNLMSIPMIPLLLVDRFQANNFFVGQLAFVSAASRLGSLYFWGHRIDRQGAFRVICEVLFLMILPLLCYGLARSRWLLFAASAFSGFAFAGLDLAVIGAMIALAKKHDPSTMMAIHQTLLGLRGVTAPLVGILLLHVIDLRLVFLLDAALILVGATLVVRSGRPREITRFLALFLAIAIGFPPGSAFALRPQERVEAHPDEIASKFKPLIPAVGLEEPAQRVDEFLRRIESALAPFYPGIQHFISEKEHLPPMLYETMHRLTWTQISLRDGKLSSLTGLKEAADYLGSFYGELQWATALGQHQDRNQTVSLLLDELRQLYAELSGVPRLKIFRPEKTPTAGAEELPQAFLDYERTLAQRMNTEKTYSVTLDDRGFIRKLTTRTGIVLEDTKGPARVLEKYALLPRGAVELRGYTVLLGYDSSSIYLSNTDAGSFLQFSSEAFPKEILGVEYPDRMSLQNVRFLLEQIGKSAGVSHLTFAHGEGILGEPGTQGSVEIHLQGQGMIRVVVTKEDWIVSPISPAAGMEERVLLVSKEASLLLGRSLESTGLKIYVPHERGDLKEILARSLHPGEDSWIRLVESIEDADLVVGDAEFREKFKSRLGLLALKQAFLEVDQETVHWVTEPYLARLEAGGYLRGGNILYVRGLTHGEFVETLLRTAA